MVKKILIALMIIPALAFPAVAAEKSQKGKRKNIIPTSEYEITTSVRKVGSDFVSIAGRIGHGPVCKNMQITAVARNNSGMKARVVVFTNLSNSSGSTLFEGKRKVKGSGADNSDWTVGKVVVRCFD